MMAWLVIATKTGLDREVVAKGLATRKEAWEWKIMHAEKFTLRVLLIEREEEKKPTLKELFTGVTLDTWLERAKVKGLNEFKNQVVSASPEQETLETPFVWRAFREWVTRNLREDADVKIVLDTLDDIDKKLTYSEAQDFLMKTDDPKFAWIRIQFKDVEEMKESPLVSEMRKTIQGARGAGITDRQIITALRSMGIELERPTSKGLAEARKEIARLTEEIKRLQMEKIIPEWKPYWTETEKAVELAFREYPSEETYFRLREARPLLERAYADDPYIKMWLETHHFTLKDLEDEAVRLQRQVAGAKVPSYTLDVLKMSEEVAEKQRKMPTLMEMELILEGVQKKEKWALERMMSKYGVTNPYEFEGKVVKMREEVGDPSPQIPPYYVTAYRYLPCSICRDITRQKLVEVEGELYWECPRCGELTEYGSIHSNPELILRNHTDENIIKLATFIQTEGALGFTHLPHLRAWTPYIAFGMGMAEPAEYTAKLLSITATPTPHNGIVWSWTVQSRKALSLITLIKPHLMADKLEQAEYLLSIGRPTIPDTEWRPMYIGIIEKTLRPILLYEEYVTFPTKYAKTIRRGEELPRPIRPIILKYTPLRTPITWREGLRLQSTIALEK